MMSFRIAARTILLGVASVAFLAVPQATSAVVVVVGGDLEMVVFEVPAGSTYQIYYPTGQGADFQVWRDPDATIPVVPLQNYTVQSRGDFNQDGLLNGADIQGFVGAFVNGPFNSAGDFDGDMDIDTTDATAFVEELLYPCPVAAVVLYVEALEASAAVNDSQIDLIIGQLPPAFSELVTSVDLTVSPLTINLGTTVTVMITPTGGDLVFDQNTSASWHGYFDAVVGSDSEQFSLSYSSTQFAELTAGTASLVGGNSSISGHASLATCSGAGSLVGRFSVHLSDTSLTKDLSLSVPSERPALRAILFDQDANPYLGSVTDEVEIVLTNNGNGDSEEMLSGMYSNFLAVTVNMERTMITETQSPASIPVAIVSRDANGNILQTVPSVSLYRDDDLSTPAFINYHTEFDLPIILVDQYLDPDNYSLLVPLLTTHDGDISVSPISN